MASLNQCSFIGNVGNINTRYLPSGEAVTNISLAINDKYKDKQGQVVEHTEWIRISFFSKLAEIAAQFVKKGDPLYVSGSMRTRKYADKDGVEKYATEIRGDRMQMLGSRAGGGMADMDDGHNQAQPMPRTAEGARCAPQQRPASSGFDDMEDDFPF